MKEKDLFIRSIKLNQEKIPNPNIYPFNIPILKNFEELKLKTPVTFLVGENGTGKSTLIEALAIKCNLTPEGGTGNFMFKTKNTHSNLHEYLTVISSGSLPKTKFFLRAESFYNFSTELVRLKEEDNYDLFKVYGGNLHECSHGESFIKLVQNRFTPNGLYILDEPEAALSPSRQMTLLSLIHELANKESQFIIATHSPILIAYINGTIYDLNQNCKEVKYEETEIYNIYKMFLERHDNMQYHLFNDE